MLDKPHADGFDVKVSRRGFLAGVTALTFAVTASGASRQLFAAQSSATMNAYITINSDDRIVILVPAQEMGQGVRTSLPLIVAEELDADWAKVVVEPAPADVTKYGNPFFGGIQDTQASLSIMGYWSVLRTAGAQARRVLMDAAAKEWAVDVSGLTTEPSVIIGPKKGQRMSYGEAVKLAEVPEKLPEIAEKDLKAPKDFRLIGSDVGRVDVPAKSRGQAMYGIDAEVDGMLYACLFRSPASGQKPLSANEAEVLAVKNVTNVVMLPFGVGVVAKTYEAALEGRSLLEVTWTQDALGVSLNSEEALEDYVKIARDPNRDAVTWHEKGNVPQTLPKAVETLVSEYRADYAYHAQIEPVNATAHVKPDGTAEIWVGTQSPSRCVWAAAGALQTDPANIKVNLELLGGGFGRRADMDPIVNAVLLSKAVGAPVKAVMSREDDVKGGRFRPQTVQRIEVGLDADGKIDSWKTRLVGESAMAYIDKPRFEKGGRKDIIVMLGSEMPFYTIPNVLTQHVIEERGARLAAFRGVGTGCTKFAVESMIDELAAKAGKDPLDYRIALASNDRIKAVLNEVRTMSGWDRPRNGTTLGVSFADYHGSLTANVAEISVDEKSGEIKVHNFWCAADVGLQVHPKNVVAQIEGGIVFGISHCMLERITIVDGEVQQENYYDYEPLRMNACPNIEVKLLASGGKPLAVGELGMPGASGAIANAFATATGKRLRHLPFNPERVLKALKA